MDFGSQKNWKGLNSWETAASPSGNSHSQSDYVNLLDQLQSNDQNAKNNAGGVSSTGSKRLEKQKSLGSSLDWKPVKLMRSGYLLEVLVSAIQVGVRSLGWIHYIPRWMLNWVPVLIINHLV